MLTENYAVHQIRHVKSDLQRIIDALPDLIAIIDSTYSIINVNKAMAERCGVPPEALVGSKCHEVIHGGKSTGMLSLSNYDAGGAGEYQGS
jgi:PAS domain S-box-containing protein